MQTPPQITTVFSVNPSTGTPYIDVESATKIIQYHVSHFGKNVLNVKGRLMEDIVQDVLTKLCYTNFDIKKSSAKTFIIMVATHKLANISNHNKTFDKHKEVSDFSISTDDGDFMVTQLLGVENVTAEDVLLADELANHIMASLNHKKKSKEHKGWKKLKT